MCILYQQHFFFFFHSNVCIRKCICLDTYMMMYIFRQCAVAAKHIVVLALRLLSLLRHRGDAAGAAAVAVDETW